MSWKIVYSEEAQRDIRSLDKSKRVRVSKAIERVSQNPLPFTEGGYGKPLGNKNGRNLTGVNKIVLKSDGLRVAYEVLRTETTMLIIVVGVRTDEEVYELAARRIQSKTI